MTQQDDAGVWFKPHILKHREKSPCIGQGRCRLVRNSGDLVP